MVTEASIFKCAWCPKQFMGKSIARHSLFFKNLRRQRVFFLALWIIFYCNAFKRRYVHLCQFFQNWISSFRNFFRKKNGQSLTLCNVGFWTSCLLTTLDIINLFCLTLSAVMYCGSEDIRYFWMFSWDDIIRGGGGGGTGVGRQFEPASPVDDAVSFWLGSVFKVLLFTLDGVAARCNTVPVDEVVEEAVEVDDEVGKWDSKAHSSPNIASEIIK